MKLPISLRGPSRPSCTRCCAQFQRPCHLVSGTQSTPGAVYRYANIGTTDTGGIAFDALVTLGSLSGGAVFSTTNDFKQSGGRAFTSVITDIDQESFGRYNIRLVLNSDNSISVGGEEVEIASFDIDSNPGENFTDFLGIAAAAPFGLQTSQNTSLVLGSRSYEGTSFTTVALDNSGDLSSVGNTSDGATNFNANQDDISAIFSFANFPASGVDILHGSIPGLQGDLDTGTRARGVLYDGSGTFNFVTPGDTLSVPEPSVGLLAMGALGLLGLRRRR